MLVWTLLRNIPMSGLQLHFFILSICGHWFFGWMAYVQEQEEFDKPIEFSEYANQMLRDTFENWQSEFFYSLSGR